MSSEFKVGDKVRVLAGGEGVVTYGPFNSTFDTYKMYVVKQDGDDERAFKNVDLSPLPAFAVGDKVTLDTRGGAQATVEYGPFDGENVYVVKLVKPPTDGNPRTFTTLASVMHAVTEPALVSVGTRVRVDRATYATGCHGRTAVVTSNTETWRDYHDDTHVYRVAMDGEDGEVYAAEVTPIAESADGFEYEGVVYEYGALYRDREGDLFRFRSTLSGDGTPRGQAVFGPADDEGGAWHWSLAEVLSDYAPLIKQH
ncbi:phiSA1p31-related protein [Streptomyces californicus]|uniref:phiSA1p31-related protein n=1 Tax=Streptomyces californicus TaxID=67351 RepID=UPI0035D9759F